MPKAPGGVNEASPSLTVVITTHDRNEEVEGAVKSALDQTLRDVEVVVVDDASARPVELTPHPRVRCLRLEENRGFPGARNAGLAAARGRWITFLDDDDRLLPEMAAASLAAIERSTLPPPVSVISAIEAVGEGGRVLARLVPATHPRGDHFFLETAPLDRSHMTKNTLVVERDLLRSLGGFDPTLRSRAMSDLFLRLNPVCSILGIPTVTYRLTRTPRPGTLASRRTSSAASGSWWTSIAPCSSPIRRATPRRCSAMRACRSWRAHAVRSSQPSRARCGSLLDTRSQSCWTRAARWG